MSLTKDWNRVQARATPYLAFWRLLWWLIQGSGNFLNLSQPSCTLLNRWLYCHTHDTTGFIMTIKIIIDLLRLPSCHSPHLTTQPKSNSQISQCCARKLLPKDCVYSLPHVIIRPSNVTRRRRAYANLPGIKVEPLYFSEKDLTADRMLAIMGCDNTEVTAI